MRDHESARQQQREHSFGHDRPPLRGSRPSQCRTGRSRPLNAFSKKKFPLEWQRQARMSAKANVSLRGHHRTPPGCGVTGFLSSAGKQSRRQEARLSFSETDGLSDPHQSPFNLLNTNDNFFAVREPPTLEMENAAPKFFFARCPIGAWSDVAGCPARLACTHVAQWRMWL